MFCHIKEGTIRVPVTKLWFQCFLQNSKWHYDILFVKIGTTIFEDIINNETFLFVISLYAMLFTCISIFDILYSNFINMSDHIRAWAEILESTRGRSSFALYHLHRHKVTFNVLSMNLFAYPQVVYHVPTLNFPLFCDKFGSVSCLYLCWKILWTISWFHQGFFMHLC